MSILPVAPPLLHDWVKWSVQGVDVIVDPFTGASSAVVLPDTPVGEQIGCQSCGEPLTDSSAKTICLGDNAG